MEQPQQPIEVAALARIIREEVERLNWTYRLATGRGIPDLEVLHLAVLTLRKHGSTLTFRRAFESMGIPMDGDARGDSERRTRALAIVGSLSEEGQKTLEEVLALPLARYRIVQALVAALRTMDET